MKKLILFFSLLSILSFGQDTLYNITQLRNSVDLPLRVHILSSSADSIYTLIGSDQFVVKDSIFNVGSDRDTIILPNTLKTQGRFFEIYCDYGETIIKPENDSIYYNSGVHTDFDIDSYVKVVYDGEKWIIFGGSY